MHNLNEALKSYFDKHRLTLKIQILLFVVVVLKQFDLQKLRLGFIFCGYKQFSIYDCHPMLQSLCLYESPSIMRFTVLRHIIILQG